MIAQDAMRARSAERALSYWPADTTQPVLEATVVQSFGILGALVGLVTIAIGIGPRTLLDLTLNGTLLLTLIVGLASTLRKP